MIDAHTHLENGDLSVEYVMFISLLMLPKKKGLLIFKY